MEFKTPDWLTKEYIKDALENGQSYKVTIENLKLGMPVAKGENYSSDIFKADIDYRQSNDLDNLRNKSLIIKAPKYGPMHNDMVKAGFLEKEPRIYNEFSPKLKSVFFGSGSFDEDNEHDEYILAESYVSNVEHAVILGELKCKGYKLADRLKRLDFDHCAVALKALAKFHAGSRLIYEKEPDFIKDLGKEIAFCEDPKINELNRIFFGPAFKVFGQLIKNYPETKKYSNWFEDNVDNIFQLLIDCFKVDDKEFKVLNHGDFWVSNMLFKYDENNVPIKVKPLDFQLARFTSPVMDFIYFMDGSAQETVRKENIDDLINIYLNELNSTLERYGGSRRLERSEFEKSLKERSHFRVYASLVLLPICIANIDSSEMFDVKELKKDDVISTEKNPMLVYYKNKNFIEIISKRMQEWEQLGLITAT